MITVVFVGGFLNPEGHIPYPNLTEINGHKIHVIPVYPASVSSLHDRAMQVFYELKGGKVHYGEEHASFHGHDEESEDSFPGKLADWSEEQPIHIVGHSFGGLTARVLHAYLAEGNRFKGHFTSKQWIVSVNTMNAPLNGCRMVYSLGANETLSPVVRWGSAGFCIGFLAHIFEYFNFNFVRRFHDFKLHYWRLRFDHPRAPKTLLKAMCGLCIHSSTDNAAYDMTLQSQLVWADYLRNIPGTFYASVVGTTYANTPSYLSYLAYHLRPLFLRAPPLMTCGIDTSDWNSTGFDGLVSARSQAFPFLSEVESITVIDPICSQECDGLKEDPLLMPDTWHVAYFASDHVNCVADAWLHVLTTISRFHASSYLLKEQQQQIPAQDDHDEDDDDDDHFISFGSGMSPDMQLPFWSLADRPRLNNLSSHATQFLYDMGLPLTVGLVLLSTLGDESNKWLLQSSLGPLLLLSFMLKLSSDDVEIIAGLARMAVIIIALCAPETSQRGYQCILIYNGLLTADGITCLLSSPLYEYSLPRLKLLMAFIIMQEPPLLPSLLMLLLCQDASSLLAKVGWRINESRPTSSESLKWIFLWSVHLIVSGFSLILLFARGNYYLDASWFLILRLFMILVFGFTRLRDLSDAYQTEHLLHKKYLYLQSRQKKK